MSAQMFDRCVQSIVSMMVMMLAVVAVSFVGVAQVDARPQPAKVTLKFDRLDVVQEGSRLTVDYVIDRNDWNALQKAKIEPRMDLYLPGQGRNSSFEHHAGYTLSRNSGKVVFQRVPEKLRQNEVGIRVESAKGQNRIGMLSFGRQKGAEIRVKARVIEPSRPVQPSRPVEPSRPSQPSRPHHPSRPVEPSRPHHPREDSQVDIINACKQSSTFSSDFDKCLADAKHLRGQQVAIINACGQYRHGLSACMQKASRLPAREEVSIIRACGQHSTFASDMSSCLDNASGFRQEAAPVIEACGQATRFGSEMQKCMQITSTYRRPAAPIIRACKSAATFSSDFEKCLEQSR